MRRSFFFVVVGRLVVAAAMEKYASSSHGELKAVPEYDSTVVEERANVSRSRVPSSRAPLVEIRASELRVKKRRKSLGVVTLDASSFPASDNVVLLPKVSSIKSKGRSKALMLFIDLIPAAVFVALLFYLRRRSSLTSLRSSLAWAANQLVNSMGAAAPRWIPVNPEPEQYWEIPGTETEDDDSDQPQENALEGE
ncbi:hypothetical protein CSUI_005030 [Cystoisospora suis]|uniref:Transmembrane protein n=1 Tax=Cystoisospora suis TaxID=483139 RepID=A0A2C6KV67_9APIC|nr:hypothetical protein CSUI_005030 [Cystoisospora suis]